MSNAFQLLHPTVQRKLWDMKWTELRPIQVESIEHLLGGTPTDCIISSPTASGKTEAAFLPVLSAIADEPTGGVRAMYIGPLKALINDQFGRVEELCTRMEMPVHRWHGDVDGGARKTLLNMPSGVLLITPESLEAMFVLRATQLPSLFGRLSYVVIDETHAFLGTQRGAQLISQLHRLRVRAGVDPIRIGLSATLGDPNAAKRWLRRDGRPVKLIDPPSTSSAIRLRIRGLWRQRSEDDGTDDDADDPALVEVARGILLACHGKTNLVFANSKGMIEELADELASQARATSIADDIVVHHGSLSKDEREHAEERLRSGRPCTAVCSNTLELGIDIGSIDEVIQVSPPWSVASLVQRLGRSGRRPGSNRILRGFFVEDVPGPDATLWDRLHIDFIRGLASVQLMLEGWLEAPAVDGCNLSTLIQQILSTLAETGGIRAHDLFSRLNASGAFAGVKRGDFAPLLRELGARDLIEQLPDSTLVLGLKGQRIVEHYSFYAAFKSATEFQVLHRERSIGALPENMLPAPGEHLILAGRRWLVEEIDVDRRQVFVSPSRGRRPPRFASAQPDGASTVHARMRAVLLGEDVPSYLDETACEILRNARLSAREGRIELLVQLLPDRAVLSLWAGSKILRTLWLVLVSAGVKVVAAEDVALEIMGPTEAWTRVLRRFVDAPDARALAQFAEEKLYARITDGEKFDKFLPAELWRANYVRERLDIEGTARVVTRVLADLEQPPVPEGAGSVAVPAISVPSMDRWATAIAALQASTPFPSRTVLVPSEAHAHALRVELARQDPGLLAGTRFLTAAAAARAVLDSAGIEYELGEEIKRPLRLRKVIRGGPTLTTYDIARLRTRGWEEAFGSTIEQLESAGLRPEDLDALHDERASDLATLWRAIDADAGHSWTIPTIMTHARAVLIERGSAAWPFAGPVLACASIAIDASHARFLRVIPSLTLAILPGRPARRRAIDRVRALLGDEAARIVADVRCELDESNELAILSEFLFEAPDRLAAPDRRRSMGQDGSVSLERFAGVDEELEAAARWVEEQVAEHQTPLQEIAILTPTADPLAVMIADRIRALTWPVEVDPVYLASGRPAVSTASGARLLAVLTALTEFLPAEHVIELLPRLRMSNNEGHITPRKARLVVADLATLGGSTARPRDALGWRTRLGRPELGESTRALAPALDALVTIAEEMIAGASLATLWQRIEAFATTFVIGPREMLDVVAQLGSEVVALAMDPVTTSVVGLDAVELITLVLRDLRTHAGRFGQPSIYVGPIHGAAGLQFSAVRVVGLAEGAFPGTLREDAILPRDLRRRLPAYAMATDDDFATARLHAFDQVIRGAKARLSLSVPRADLDGSEREPASLFVEVAAALGRRNAITGAANRVIPTIDDLERDAFSIARIRNQTRAAESPFSAAAWLERVARSREVVPSAWCETVVANPIALLDCSMDGMFGSAPLSASAWGASPERPLSASALSMLLTCPQRFLLERMLGFRPREGIPTSHRIDALAYGSLFHQIAEAFYRANGAEFGRRERDIGSWLTVADDIANAAFDAFLDTYPLIAKGVIENERRRLRRDVRTLVEDDWDQGKPRRFVAVEYDFGDPTPISISTAAGPLYVAGRIDRIDVEHGMTLVRDLKTGRAKPRERDHVDPEVDVDLQLALYVEVARKLAPPLSIPHDVAAAYAYVDPLASNRERAFRTDRQALQVAGQRWFELAMALVRDQLYVKTPRTDDCGRCPFSIVCGNHASASAERLQDATGPLGAFRELKT